MRNAYSPYQCVNRGIIPTIYTAYDLQKQVAWLNLAIELNLPRVERTRRNNVEFIARQLNQQMLEYAADKYYKKV